ncbi:MAG: hypothetical protein H7Y20_11055, partial [Bryobacteraceae bacterium]|nr:hypothetical protein [Bryobacteraceae bacterium]
MIVTQATSLFYAALVGLLLFVSGCGQKNDVSTNGSPRGEPVTVAASKDGPDTDQVPQPHKLGDAASGKEVFRFETFGNEGFWTDAMRLPKGVMDKKLTPIQALEVGLQIDIEAIDAPMKAAMEAELKTDMSAQNAPLLNDVMTTVKLIEANAVIGVVTKDSNQDGKLSIASGDKVGLSCAVCHTVTDGSVYRHAKGGSIGRRIDGLAALDLNVGKILATAANSRAYYPNLQLELGGKTIGRAPKGIKADSTEEEVDAYLSNPEFYPIGTFDETQDGIGNPVVNTPLFRQDLAAPYGSAGEHALLDGIGNGSYTTNLDPTTLVTPEGREFLKLRGGKAGEEIANNYAKILEETGVKGHPFVKADKVGKVGDPASPVGLRVDNKKLFDMSAYLESLPAPKGAQVDPSAFDRGRQHFRASCTSCHNV